MKSFLKQINESFQSLEEKEAKPDFLDLDGDGDIEEPMKKAAKDKKQNPVKKELNKSLFGKGQDLEFKTCEDCSGKLTPHLKDKCQRCTKNEAVDQDNDGNNDFDDVKIARMMASGMSKEDALKKVQEEKEIDEVSTSAGAGSYMTPKAFGKADDATVEAMGYKRVQETMDRKYEQLIEGYRDFALGKKNSSPSKTVNASIREVAKKLKEIEETVKYTGRLKTESGISHSGFSSGTHNALRKISERLIKISERVRSLGE